MVTILERKFDDKYLQKVKNNLQNEYDEVLILYDKCISFIKEHIDKDWYEKLGDFLDFSSEQIFILSAGLVGKGIAKAIELIHKNIRNNEREKYHEYFDDKGRPSILNMSIK